MAFFERQMLVAGGTLWLTELAHAGHESGEDSVEVYREVVAANDLLYRSLPGSAPGEYLREIGF